MWKSFLPRKRIQKDRNWLNFVFMSSHHLTHLMNSFPFISIVAYEMRRNKCPKIFISLDFSHCCDLMKRCATDKQKTCRKTHKKKDQTKCIWFLSIAAILLIWKMLTSSGQPSHKIDRKAKEKEIHFKCNPVHKSVIS